VGVFLLVVWRAGMTVDLFAALGLPRRWSLTQEALSEAFRAESRKFHPDRCYNKSAAEKREAMARTTDITEAYRTLKDRVARATYLLRTFGKTIDEKASVPDDRLVLMEVMDAREQAQDLRAKGAAGAEELSNICSDFGAKVAAIEAEIDAAFAAIDGGEDPRKVVDRLHGSVIRHRYYCGTRDEIKRALVAVRS
jgi:molecular chaperone HscB